jgi:hypothetical protein
VDPHQSRSGGLLHPGAFLAHLFGAGQHPHPAGGAGCCCARSAGPRRSGRSPLPRPDPPTAARKPPATASRSPVVPAPLRQWPRRQAQAGCPGPHGCQK